METVYIETSVVSYLVAKPSRDAVTAWRQRLTREWWIEQRGRFVCVISPEVIAEAAAGDVALAEQRKSALLELPLLSGGKESTTLAADLMSHNLFPPNARSDALHLAIATCAEVDYLLTWNYRHLANAVMLRQVEDFLRQHRLKLPRVCTPEELMAQ
jgi:hypothetical protein